MSNKQAGFATRAIHVGQEPDAETGAVSPPIHPTSTYVQQELGKHKGYEYSRGENPTRTRLEQNLAALEGGVAAPVFASGMAAINAISSMYKSGDHIVCGHNLYGGVPRLFNQVLADFGLEFTYVDTSEVRNVERAIRKNTRIVYVETPTNPLMALSDIEAIAQVCHRKKVELVVRSDHIVCGHNLYGGVPRLFNQVLADFGLEFTYVDTSEVRNVERAIRKNTRIVYVETPTNPLMALSDIEAIAQVCHRKKVELVV